MEQEVKEKSKKVVKSSPFRKVFGVLSLCFIVLTFFIAAKPDTFAQFNYPGVFVFSIISSPLLIIPFMLGKINVILFVIAAAVGSVINSSINYLLGNSGKEYLPNAPFVEKPISWIKRFQYPFVYLFAAIPLPIDVNGFASGFASIPYKWFAIITFAGKMTVYALLAAGIVMFKNSS